MTILEKNKKKWKTDEDIVLKVRVKNVSGIQVRTYRLDLERHYMEKETEIDQLMDISYLHPNHSSSFVINHNNPYIVEMCEMKMEGIPKERGAWIVELEGEGITSRAFIRKGMMGCMSSMTAIGTELRVFDESGAEIRGYKVWMEGRSHDVSLAFPIPYGEVDKSLSLVVSKDGYS
jgi:hypothetical protein